jgi:hypothetical protein
MRAAGRWVLGRVKDPRVGFVSTMWKLDDPVFTLHELEE